MCASERERERQSEGGREVKKKKIIPVLSVLLSKMKKPEKKNVLYLK